MTCTNTITLGAYLLGALEPHERFAFEAHLAGCDTCRAELVRLAPLPGMLNQISLDDFADDLPPTTLEEAHPTAPLPGPIPYGSLASPVLTPLSSLPGGEGPGQGVPIPRLPAFDEPLLLQVADDTPDTPDRPGRRSRRKRLWLVAAAAVVAVAITFGGIFGWQATHQSPPPEAAGITWSAMTLDGRASAAARLVDHEWGTEIQLRIQGLPPGRRCYLMVYDAAGNREIAGWWGTDHDYHDEIPASTSFQRSKIDHLELRLDDKAVALTIPSPGR
ncbi:zf-HC2 domain-containing protein [Actinophytocola sp.]|jgi:hypothetical protein|uniref:anti-sigma factor family protein n=1 Tax=Actinophytocola sp. TaxID=1872138 RepID=UPI002ED810B0